MDAETRLTELFAQIEELKTEKESDKAKARDAVTFANEQINEKRAKLNEAIENGDAKTAGKIASELSANEQILKSLEEKEADTTNKRYLTFEQYKELKTNIHSALTELEQETRDKIATCIPKIKAMIDNYFTFSDKASNMIYDAFLELLNPDLPGQNPDNKTIVANSESHIPYPEHLPVGAVKSIEDIVK